MKTLKIGKIILFFSLLGLLNSTIIYFNSNNGLISSLIELDRTILNYLTYPFARIISSIFPGDLSGIHLVLVPFSSIFWGIELGVFVYLFLYIYNNWKVK